MKDLKEVNKEEINLLVKAAYNPKWVEDHLFEVKPKVDFMSGNSQFNFFFALKENESSQTLSYGTGENLDEVLKDLQKRAIETLGGLLAKNQGIDPEKISVFANL